MFKFNMLVTHNDDGLWHFSLKNSNIILSLSIILAHGCKLTYVTAFFWYFYLFIYVGTFCGRSLIFIAETNSSWAHSIYDTTTFPFSELIYFISYKFIRIYVTGLLYHFPFSSLPYSSRQSVRITLVVYCWTFLKICQNLYWKETKRKKY